MDRIASPRIPFQQDSRQRMGSINRGFRKSGGALAAWSEVSVGTEVDHTVKRQGEKVGLVATLDNVPADLRAQWVTEYVMESNAKSAVASNN